MDLELHFNVDFIHLTAAEGYIVMFCYPSIGISLLDVSSSESQFLSFDGLRVSIEINVCVLGKAMASYAVVKRCCQPVEGPVFDSMGSG